MRLEATQGIARGALGAPGKTVVLVRADALAEALATLGNSSGAALNMVVGALDSILRNIGDIMVVLDARDEGIALQLRQKLT